MMTNHTLFIKEGCFNKLLHIFQTTNPTCFEKPFLWPENLFFLSQNLDPAANHSTDLYMTKFLVVGNGPESVSEAVIVRRWQFGQVFGGDNFCPRHCTVKAGPFKLC